MCMCVFLLFLRNVLEDRLLSAQIYYIVIVSSKVAAAGGGIVIHKDKSETSMSTMCIKIAIWTGLLLVGGWMEMGEDSRAQ